MRSCRESHAESIKEVMAPVYSSVIVTFMHIAPLLPRNPGCFSFLIVSNVFLGLSEMMALAREFC